MHSYRPDPKIGELIRFGTIASIDLAAARVTVRLGEIETAPIRWLQGSAGSLQVWIRPSVGEQVTLLCPEGDIAGAVALRGMVTDVFPPVADPDRDVIQFPDGSIIAYDSDAHALDAVLAAGATARVVADGGIAIEGDVTITGSLTVSEAIAAQGAISSADDVTADGISLHNHKHGGVQAGGAKTGAPE